MAPTIRSDDAADGRCSRHRRCRHRRAERDGVAARRRSTPSWASTSSSWAWRRAPHRRRRRRARKVALTTSGCPLRAQIQKDVRRAGRRAARRDEGAHRLGRADPGGEGRRHGQGPAPHRRASPTDLARADHQGHHGGVGQGRGGQVVGHGQPGRARSPPRATPSGSWTPTSGASRSRACWASTAAWRRPSAEGNKITPHHLVVGRRRLEVVSMGFLVDDEGRRSCGAGSC